MGSIETVKDMSIQTLQVEDIPNCSTNDQIILELITDDEVDLEQLAALIEESPSLVAMIIGLANSAYFSAPTPIHSVKDAIIKVLGMRMVRSIVLSVVLGRSLDLTNCPNFSSEDYWADALTTARYCQILTINTDFKKMVSIDQIYLCALLANFGSLVLIHHYPKVMNDVLEQNEGNLNDELELQQQHLGMTQAEAGVLLGRRWQLPPMVLNTMHHCLDTQYEGQDWAVCRLVGEVMQLVNQVRLGDTELTLSPACEKILKTTSKQCQLDEIKDLREGLLLVARHLSQAT